MLVPNSVSIIGCGWLGKFLGQSLAKKNYLINGSVRRSESKGALVELTINPFQYDLTDVRLPSGFLDSEYWVFLVPFRRSLERPEMYLDTCKQFLSLVKYLPLPKKFIFTSSTLVYSADQSWKTEQSDLDKMELRPKILIETEDLFFKFFGDAAVILRLGGLYGNGRLIKSFNNKPGTVLKNGPINLISQENACQAIRYCIENNLESQVYNIVEPYHPDRRLLYADNPSSSVSAPNCYKVVSGYRFSKESGLLFN